MITIIISLLVGAASLTALAVLLTHDHSRRSSHTPVVASTNVYGDIARQIGGGRLEVTSILSDPNADPHLFEPGTSNGLAVARARLVIENGLGYDSFMSRLEAAAPSRNRVVVVIAKALGISGKSANPHLWYALPRLGEIASAIALGLERADPDNANRYRTGLRRFVASLGPLKRQIAEIKATDDHEPVAYTEPVPGYLLTAAGLRNLAPEAFTRAIENGTEPTPAAVSEMTHLLSARRVRVLLYNNQAVSSITARIRAAARHANIPVVGVSETLPLGLTFQAWQLRQARALAQALAR